jgi:hypothetical protein
MPRTEEQKLQRKKYREKDYASLKEWRKKNPDKFKAYLKKYYDKNKEAISTKRKKLYAENPEVREKHKALNREWLYGITDEQYKILVEVQNGLCAICLKSTYPKPLYVDHNHITNKIRGLLCINCNNAIGQVKENVEILLNMINYIQEHA